MAEEMVKVGCKLPHGLILEVGYSVVSGEKNGTNRHVSVQQHADYTRVRLLGWSDVDGSKAAYRAGLILPAARLNPEVAVTDVPKEFWIRWKREHSEMWKRLSGKGILFEANDTASAAAMSIDHKDPKVKSGFEAKDPKNPGPNVTKANFED